MPSELPVDGAPGGVQPAVAAAARARGLPAALRTQVTPRPALSAPSTFTNQ